MSDRTFAVVPSAVSASDRNRRTWSRSSTGKIPEPEPEPATSKEFARGFARAAAEIDYQNGLTSPAAEKLRSGSIAGHDLIGVVSNIMQDETVQASERAKAAALIGDKAGDDLPVYDLEQHRWSPRCPFGDVCTGCDAARRCSRVPAHPVTDGGNRSTLPGS